MTTEAGIIYLPNRWSGDTHSDKATGCVDVDATEQLIAKQAAEIERLKSACAKEFDSVQELDCKLGIADALLRQALVLLRGPAPNGYGVGSEQEAVIAAIKTHLGEV